MTILFLFLYTLNCFFQSQTSNQIILNKVNNFICNENENKLTFISVINPTFYLFFISLLFLFSHSSQNNFFVIGIVLLSSIFVLLFFHSSNLNLNSNQFCLKIKQIIFHSQKELENIYIPNDYDIKGNKHYLFSSIITSFIINQNQFLMIYSIPLIIITIIQFILDYFCLSSIISFGITICISIITILFEILLFSVDENSYFLFVGSCILFQIFICLSCVPLVLSFYYIIGIISFCFHCCKLLILFNGKIGFIVFIFMIVWNILKLFGKKENNNQKKKLFSFSIDYLIFIHYTIQVLFDN